MPVQFYALTGLFNGLLALFFGLFVFFKNRKNIVNQTGSLLTLATAIWGLSYWRWLLALNYDSALFWARMLSLGSTLIPVFYFHWVITLLGLHKKRKGLINLAYLFTLICVLINFSSYFVKDVEPRLQFPFWPTPGLAYHFYLAISYGGMVFYTCYYLIRHYKDEKGYKKERLKYVILGSILGFGGGATNFPLWYNIQIEPIGNLLVAFYPILFTYAIVRYRLMDIKFILRNSFVYLSTLATIIIFAVTVAYLIESYLPQIFTLAEVIILITAVSIFVPLRNYFYRTANKYFFSSLYESRTVMAELSDKLSSTLEIDKIHQFISDTLINSFHTTKLGILMFNEKRQEYKIAYNKNFDTGQRRKFRRDKNLSSLFTLHQSPVASAHCAGFIKKDRALMVEEIKNDIQVTIKSKDTVDLLTKYGVEILIPLNIKNKTIGLIVLGTKESGDMYNSEDLRLLEIIGAQSAIALQNAKLYQESLAFGEKLKKEVEEATLDLRVANEHLKELDKTKTEFLSIASHQLRTPLSGIKGYLSMVLEGDFGKVEDEQNKILQGVFQQTQRLVRLVNVFLNVSRIESGRLKLEKTKFDLMALVQESINELKAGAARKKLKLEFEKATTSLEIMADRDKLADVILNLIDNAIKYTEKGQISVKLELKNNKARLSVKDTGVGIAAGEADKLFTKFVRGREGAKINTSGSGLGLFVVKKIVELHQGKIWVESQGQGKGSKFIFELPCWDI